MVFSKQLLTPLRRGIITDGEVTITAVDELISGDIIIPSDIDGYPVTSIGERAFEWCGSISSVILPEGLKSIGNNAFYFCSSLESASIPNSVTNIEDSAFYACGSLENIIIPKGVTVIGFDTFAYCGSLKSVTIPKSVEEIEESAFDYCYSLETVWYVGSKSDKEKICIGWGNEYLNDAKWNYNACPIGANHIYDDICDATCNICGSIRTKVHNYSAATCTSPKTCKECGAKSGSTIDHTYSNLCDTKCNKCDKKREVGPHKYSNDCDKSCNICGATRKVSAHKYSNSCDKSCNICGSKRSIKHSYKTTTKKAKLSKNGSIIKKCKVCGNEGSKVTIRHPETFKLSATKYAYNGKAKKPKVTVKDSNGKKISSKYYTVSYASGTKNIGKHKVTVKFKGNYSGKKTLEFIVLPTTKDKIDTIIGATIKIGAKSNKKINYSSSNKKVVKVNANGVITAVKKGKATIIVKSGKVQQKIAVNVGTPSVKISSPKKSMYIGESVKLTATTKPNKANVSWSVSNKKLAKISSSGKITGEGKGTVTVTAKIKYNGKTYKDTFKIKISVDYPNVSVFMSQEFDYKSCYGISIENNSPCKLTVLDKGSVYCNKEQQDITSLYTDDGYCSSVNIPSGSEQLMLLCMDEDMWFYTIKLTSIDIYVKYRGETFIITCWSDYDSGFVTPDEITWVKK